MAWSDDLISFHAFVAISTNASTVSDTSFDCVLFDFMIRLCDFYLIGIRRTDKLFIFSLIIILLLSPVKTVGMTVTTENTRSKNNQSVSAFISS